MTTSVTQTLHSEDADRCVKIIKRSDGTFGFSEFRRDPEDAGRWTLVGDHPQAIPTEAQALAAARAGVGWLRDTAPRVVLSLHNDEVDRCVDIIRHPDGTFGIKEFRRDPEDRGGWTLVGHNPRAVFATQDEAVAAARAAVAWLRDRSA